MHQVNGFRRRDALRASGAAAIIAAALFFVFLPSLLASAGCKLLGRGGGSERGDYRAHCTAVGRWDQLLAEPPGEVTLRVGPMPPERREAVIGAALDWTSATGGRVRWRILPAEDGQPKGGERASASDGLPADVSVVLASLTGLGGLTDMDRDTGETAPEGRMLRATVYLDPKGSRDLASFRRCAAHELGHALGIDGHSPNRRDVMHEDRGSGKPTARDLRTLAIIYGVAPGAAPSPSPSPSGARP